MASSQAGMLCAVGWARAGCAASAREMDDDAEGPDVKTMKEVQVDSDDDAEVDISSVLASGLEGVQMQDSDQQSAEDSEDDGDNRIQESDAVIIAARMDEEASHLEIYVYEDDDVSPNLFVHHDVLLPTIPLCVAWTSATPLQAGGGSGTGNFCAVGTFFPGIDVINLDDLESVEPALTLGGFVPGKKKKTNSSGQKFPPVVEDSHQAAVMSLSWNPQEREYLASASADKSVKVWDIENANCVQTLTTHSDKVQKVTWHPSERGLLLTGGFDKKIHLTDARAGTNQGSISLVADVEDASWRSNKPNEFVVALENGHVVSYDYRALSNGALWDIKAHGEAVSGFALSTSLPEVMATGSTTKTIKLWDISSSPMLLHEGPGHVGAVFGLSFCDDGKSSPFLLSAVGSRGKLTVLDTALQSSAVREKFASAAPEHAATAQRRAQALENLPVGDENDGQDSQSDDSGDSG